MSQKLAGKVALITGGSRGIGAAIARRLAADGASVAITYSASPAKAEEVVRAITAAGGKGFQGGSVYALTKAALVGFTKGLARDLGPHGITVNNVQPSPTDTDRNPATGEWAKGTVQNVALQRYAKPEEVANFVAFLASPEASYITDASLGSDGGYSA